MALYRSVRCPKCKEVKVTRYPTFRHCGKSWNTEKHGIQAQEQRKARTSKPRGQYNTLEVSW